MEMGKGAQIATAEVVKAPETEVMLQDPTLLADKTGLVIRQVSQWDEALIQACCDVPVERRNKYKVSGIPPGKRAIHAKNDPGGWKPTEAELQSIPQELFAQEESSLCERFMLGLCGCMNLRELEMNFQRPDGATGMTVHRELGLGGGCCCPFKADLNFFSPQGKYVAGKVEQDFHCGKNYLLRCFQNACCCLDYYDLMVAPPPNQPGEFQKRYQLEVSLCCCGPHFNCCGATPFCNDILFNVYPYTPEGVVNRTAPAGYLQKTYATNGGCTSFCRCCCMFSNWLVEFPPNAPVVDKALFIAAFVNTEYIFFERKGNDNNG